MAPEVLQGAVTFQSESFLFMDIYALALVMWELLSRTNTCSGILIFSITVAPVKAKGTIWKCASPVLKTLNL